MRTWRLPVRAMLCLAALSLAVGPRPSAAESEPEGGDVESCIACHRNPDFLVTEPRLYHYYRDWERSLHHDQGVTCADCHGGDPDAPGREQAHAGMLGESEAESSVNFANVPDTCGTCHDEVEAAYRKSAHFEHLTARKPEKEGDSRQGPSCITCHDSMNTLTLDVTTVEETCSICHNADTGNHPEIPEAAREAMRRFLSIDRFHRFVAIRLEPEEAKAYLSGIDARREELSVLWHTFDLDRIERETRAILDDLGAKRREIRSRSRTEGAGREEPDSGSVPR